MKLVSLALVLVVFAGLAGALVAQDAPASGAPAADASASAAATPATTPPASASPDAGHAPAPDGGEHK